jgi:hypothetical protein
MTKNILPPSPTQTVEMALREDVMYSLTPVQRAVVRDLATTLYVLGLDDGLTVAAQRAHTEYLVPEQSAAQAKAQDGHG